MEKGGDGRKGEKSKKEAANGRNWVIKGIPPPPPILFLSFVERCAGQMWEASGRF